MRVTVVYQELPSQRICPDERPKDGEGPVGSGGEVPTSPLTLFGPYGTRYGPTRDTVPDTIFSLRSSVKLSFHEFLTTLILNKINLK